MNTKQSDNLYRLVADLVEMLIEYGAEENSILEVLDYHGITKEQAKEWYGIDVSDDDE